MGLVECAPHVWLPFPQALAIAAVAVELGEYHWHLNSCGCCVSVHGSDCAYVIGADGEKDCYPGRGCDCESVS